MRVLYLSLALIVGSFHTARAQQQAEPLVQWVGEPTTAPLANPLLRFDVVKMPRTGVVEGVSGHVEVLKDAKEWLQLSNGATLTNGSRVRIGEGAALVVRFSPSEKMEFLAAPNERWVVFEVSAKP